VPSAPTGLYAAAGDGVASVSWNAATGNGTIIDYYVVADGNGGSHTVAHPSTSLSIPASNGAAYTFSVTAVGVNGAVGPPSAASQSVVPSGAPAAPSNLSAVATSPTSVRVTFDQQSPTNGTTVTGWTAQVSGGGAQPIASGDTIGGLAPSTPYTITVVATAANGRTSSASTTVTTPAAPSPPGAVTGLRAGASSASWAAAPGATSYVVLIEHDVAGVSTQTVTGLSVSYALIRAEGLGVSVTVTPVNADGSGPSAYDSYYVPCGAMGCP
jgi:Fibronectin type III domain